MPLSVVMPTRNRGNKVVPTVESVLGDPASVAEFIIIDQSTSDETGIALEAAGLRRSSRLVYHRGATVGASRARNEGIRLASGDVIAFIDDDCVANPGWGSDIASLFSAQPAIALFYGPVIAAPEAAQGWIPEYRPLREGFVTSPSDIIRSMGLTANFALRRSALERIGGFDELLGPGAEIPNGEDTDLGYRAFRAGLGVYTANAPAVIHHGLRQQDEIRATASRYLFGMAATAMKHVRCGDFAMARPVLRELGKLSVQGTLLLIQGQRPSGYRGVANLILGSFASFRFGVDTRRRLYQPWFRAS